MTTLAVLLLFLLGAAAPTAAVAAPATATTTAAAPPALTSPSYTNGELAERETERGHGVRRGPRHAAPLPPPDAPAARDRASAVRAPSTGGPGAPPRTGDGRQRPSALSVLHCVFRC
ncbi:hypothetical protein OG422_01435 [Streptomyces sp. NBC_01525]|uniref:hypothetical protein n=1 Tax=Streptomyces TaxID=1883 RepID=UPI00163DB69C|nr:hypothetical protein [Streptomyces benahoarensis]